MIREIILGEKLVGSKLIPLKIVKGEGAVCTTYYLCFCTGCDKTCVKRKRLLLDSKGSKACPVCVRKEQKKNDKFNLPLNEKGWERRRELYEKNRTQD